MGRLLCGLLHPYAPVEQHRAAQHKGFNSKAKQNSKGNRAVVCFSVAGEGNGWNGEIKNVSGNSQNNPALRLYFNFSENELRGLTGVTGLAAVLLELSQWQLIAPTLRVQLQVYFYQFFREKLPTRRETKDRQLLRGWQAQTVQRTSIKAAEMVFSRTASEGGAAWC